LYNVYVYIFVLQGSVTATQSQAEGREGKNERGGPPQYLKCIDAPGYNHRNLNNHAIKLLTPAQTKANETKLWFEGYIMPFTQETNWTYSTAPEACME